MTGIQSHDPDYAFFEIVKVGRNWLLHADVTIVYVSQKREFTVQGGYIVKDTSTSNYRQIKIMFLLLGTKEKIFEIKRSKSGEYEMITEGYWCKVSQKSPV